VKVFTTVGTLVPKQVERKIVKCSQVSFKTLTNECVSIKRVKNVHEKVSQKISRTNQCEASWSSSKWIA